MPFPPKGVQGRERILIQHDVLGVVILEETPFFLVRFGIKKVMLIAMFAWVLRFGFFGVGTTESIFGILALVLSCLVYGVAFDFFNVSGAMFVQQEAPKSMQGSAQGLFMLMTNGIGASVANKNPNCE